RRVRQHVLVRVSLLRVAPFVEFIGGQRNAFVEHGGDHVDEGYVGCDAAVAVATHVGNGAHQQAAGAAAHGEDLVLRGVVFGDQVVRHVDEVGEGIFLVHQLAVVIPGAT